MSSLPDRRHYLVYMVPVTLFVATAIVVLGIGAAVGGWSNEHYGGADDPNIITLVDQQTENEEEGKSFYNSYFYCEHVRQDVLIRQPAGTLSSLAFFVASFLVAALSKHRGSSIENKAPTTTSLSSAANILTAPSLNRFVFSWFSRLYAGLLALAGTGSTLLHATLKHWGGMIDVVSIMAFVLFLFLFALARWIDSIPNEGDASDHSNDSENQEVQQKPSEKWFKTARTFGKVYFLLTIVVASFYFSVAPFVDDTILLNGICAPFCFGFVGLEARLLYRTLSSNSSESATSHDGNQKRQPCQWWWAVASLVSFGLAFVCNAFSDTDGALCYSSTSWIQGHAFWHVFAAVAMVFTYLYLSSFFSENYNMHLPQDETGREDDDRKDEGKDEATETLDRC